MGVCRMARNGSLLVRERKLVTKVPFPFATAWHMPLVSRALHDVTATGSY